MCDQVETSKAFLRHICESLWKVVFFITWQLCQFLCCRPEVENQMNHLMNYWNTSFFLIQSIWDLATFQCDCLTWPLQSLCQILLRFLNGGVLRNLNMYSFQKLCPVCSALTGRAPHQLTGSPFKYLKLVLFGYPPDLSKVVYRETARHSLNSLPDPVCPKYTKSDNCRLQVCSFNIVGPIMVSATHEYS